MFTCSAFNSDNNNILSVVISVPFADRPNENERRREKERYAERVLLAQCNMETTRVGFHFDLYSVCVFVCRKSALGFPRKPGLTSG